MISIIIPHHTETLEQLKPLLMSLEFQQGIDFNNIEVLIVNDDQNAALKCEDFRFYTNIQPRIKIFFNEKAGYMGISRQIGIDNASGEYVIFCDADDLLYGATIIYDLLTRNGADVYSYQFIEETGERTWVIHESQFTWMFAKSYRTQFLKDHNIRFSDNLLWHEDTYFNQVLLAYNPKIEVLGYIGYVWKFSPNSITRRNNAEYTSKSMCMYIDALDERLDRIRYVLPQAAFTDYCICDIAYMYSTLQNFQQLETLDTVRASIEKRLAQYIKKHDPNLNCLNPQSVPQISERIKLCMQTSLIIPQEGFWQFIQRIME